MTNAVKVAVLKSTFRDSERRRGDCVCTTVVPCLRLCAAPRWHAASRDTIRQPIRLFDPETVSPPHCLSTQKRLGQRLIMKNKKYIYIYSSTHILICSFLAKICSVRCKRGCSETLMWFCWYFYSKRINRLICGAKQSVGRGWPRGFWSWSWS